MLLEPLSQLFRRGCFGHLRQRLYELVFSVVKVLQLVYIKLSQSFGWHVFSSKDGMLHAPLMPLLPCMFPRNCECSTRNYIESLTSAKPPKLLLWVASKHRLGDK